MRGLLQIQSPRYPAAQAAPPRPLPSAYKASFHGVVIPIPPAFPAKEGGFSIESVYRLDKILGSSHHHLEGSRGKAGMSSGMATTAAPPPLPLPLPQPPKQHEVEQEEAALFHLLDELEAFKVEGRDKRGRRILRIVGKFFPARLVKPGALIRYLEERVFPELLGNKGKGGGGSPFVVVYVHTYVQRVENFPGVSALRCIYESLAPPVRDNLEAVYFVHPGLQSRLFFATFGRFLFSAGLYGKLRYVSRLEFLWEHMRRGEVEVPEFVHDHDDELEHRPLMDYGLESDHHHHRAYDAPAMDTVASMYSLRCIS